MVEGTIVNPLGLEVGINVNGVVALVEGSRFVANHVPLEQGENIVIAKATTSEGGTASAQITVYADTTGDYVRITADPESGIAPFETSFKIEASFSFSTSSLNHTGPGAVEVLSNPTPGEYTVRMTTQGLYVFSVQVTDGQNNVHTNAVTILVMDQATLDGILKGKWNGMRNALHTGNSPKATNYIASAAKNMYQYNFSLMSAYLREIAAGLEAIRMVRVRDKIAEYEMWAEQDGQIYSFYIVFVKDQDGIWRVHFF